MAPGAGKPNPSAGKPNPSADPEALQALTTVPIAAPIAITIHHILLAAW